MENVWGCVEFEGTYRTRNRVDADNYGDLEIVLLKLQKEKYVLDAR